MYTYEQTKEMLEFHFSNCSDLPCTHKSLLHEYYPLIIYITLLYHPELMIVYQQTNVVAVGLDHRDIDGSGLKTNIISIKKIISL